MICTVCYPTCHRTTLSADSMTIHSEWVLHQLLIVVLPRMEHMERIPRLFLLTILQQNVDRPTH